MELCTDVIHGTYNMAKKRDKDLEFLVSLIVLTVLAHSLIKFVAGEEPVQRENCLYAKVKVEFLDKAEKKVRNCFESIRSNEKYQRTSDSWSLNLGYNVGVDVKMVGAEFGIDTGYSTETAVEDRETTYEKDAKCTEVVYSDKFRQMIRRITVEYMFSMDGKKTGTQTVSLGKLSRDEYVMSVPAECSLNQEDLRDMGKKYLELNYKPPEHNGTIDDNIWSSKLKCGTRGNSFLNQFPIIRIETEIIINIVNT